jgi:hypothetical protein
MTDTPMDFQCYVGRYELRRIDELSEKDRKYISDSPNVRRLVQVGRAKLMRPKREALDMAVGLLLKTRMPKWVNAMVASDATLAKEMAPEADELADLERNVLAISRHVGMLKAGWKTDPEIETDLGYRHHESILDWFRVARWIQEMFGRAARLKRGFDSPTLSTLRLFIGHKSDGTHSIHIRPDSTKDALVYHAARMIAGGTTFQTCEHCGEPFLGGGMGRGAKRGDARFCTDKCRSAFHNEARRKAMRKTKL